jgi:hypothetical protein
MNSNPLDHSNSKSSPKSDGKSSPDVNEISIGIISPGKSLKTPINSPLSNITNDLSNYGSELNPTSSSSSTPQLKYREREQWANKIEFVLACMAFCIGLGNVNMVLVMINY